MRASPGSEKPPGARERITLDSLKVQPKRSGFSVPQWFLNPWHPTILLTVALLGVAEYLSHDITDLALMPFYILVSVYGSFNLFVFLASWKNGSVSPYRLDYVPPGNITYMYLTYNDFSMDSFQTLMKAARPEDMVFIVDDSTDPESRWQVDRAAELYRCRVIRRGTRSGFKAGAINNAMRIVNTEFVSIIDADETVPDNFAQSALPYFTEDDVAFVQVSHHSCNRSTSWERNMGYGVDLHWKIYQPYRNRYGVVNFLGHGAIMRVDSVREVGGFPEMVAEDIALTSELYIRGKRGVFVDDISAGEEFPPTYSAFRRRHKKWTMGSTQYMRRYIGKIVTSRLKWYQKLDIIIPAMSLPMTFILFLYILAAAFLHITSSLWLFMFALMSMITPNLQFLRLENKKDIPRALAVNALAYVSLFPTSVYYAIKGFIRPFFLVTGERKAKRSIKLELAGDMAMGIFLVSTGGFSILGVVCLMTGLLFWIYG